MVYLYTAILYTVIKQNEVLIHATTWMNLENTVLSERNQTLEATYCKNPRMLNVHNSQIHEDRE